MKKLEKAFTEELEQATGAANFRLGDKSKLEHAYLVCRACHQKYGPMTRDYAEMLFDFIKANSHRTCPNCKKYDWELK
ncbi:MAG: hypothetical protein Q4E88_02365 [Coriobacteriia bacterium]|nr:hypothetical protein [Coriobacteriia bacterium]